MNSNLLSRHRAKILPGVLSLALVITAVVLRDPLIAWFTLAPAGVDPDATAALPAAEGPADPHADHGSEDGSAIAYYTCSMHPSVRQSGPGKCPICGMDLIPITKEQVRSGEIQIDEARRQRIGVRTARITLEPMKVAIRAIGRLTYDETQLKDVTLKLKGWITRLHVNATGQHVKKGQTLFSVYSPELYAAQQEYLLARRSQLGGSDAGFNRADVLVAAARQRLKLLDMPSSQIAAIEKADKPLESIPFPSPASGYVIEKNVVEGAAVEPGQRLYRIASLDKVWVDADVYESDLPKIAVGQPAEVTLAYLPGKSYQGKVSFIYPYLDDRSRTGRVRIELPNKGLELKPDMYADVALDVDLGMRLQVPVSAVLYTGPRRLVFVDLGEGRLRPQEVRLGTRAADRYEVLEGLNDGDVVVTSGNFLLAAESRIRSATTHWEANPQTPAATAQPTDSTDASAPPADSPPADSHKAAHPTPKPSAGSKPAPKSTGAAAPAAAPPPPPADSKKEASPEVIYTCPMHPQVRSNTPGDCPICGMHLVPVPGKKP